MAKKRIYRSDVLRSAHLAAQDLHAIGALDAEAMRRFDAAAYLETAGDQASLLSDAIDSGDHRTIA